VRNIDQEPVDRFYKLRAPAYRAIHTDRYAFFLYSTGEVELYDMLLDPAQVASRAKSPQYRDVKRWLFDRLNELSACAGPSCAPEIGPDPAPAKRKKKRKGKRNIP
jgi:hypothetical protein